MTRKVWNNDEGKHVTVPSSGIDPLAPVDGSERRADPLSIVCTDCNAKVGEPCGSLLPPFGYLAIPHFARSRS